MLMLFVCFSHTGMNITFEVRKGRRRKRSGMWNFVCCGACLSVCLSALPAAVAAVVRFSVQKYLKLERR